MGACLSIYTFVTQRKREFLFDMKKILAEYFTSAVYNGKQI